MKRKALFLLVIILPVLAFSAVPGAHAACGDDPLPGVDYTGCPLTGADFTGLDLTGAIFNGATLTNAIFNGATLTNAQFIDADINGTDFTGAVLTGSAVIAGPTISSNPIFASANIQGLTFQNGLLFNPNFSGATGIPVFVSYILLGGTCPDDSDVVGTDPNTGCQWSDPTAVTIASAGTSSPPDLLPSIFTGLLLAGTVGLLLLRRGKKGTEAQV